MNAMTRRPVHPGQYIREEFLEPYGITQADFAKALQLHRVTVSKILNGRQSVSPDVALRLSQCLETSPEVWLNMQIKYDIWYEQQNCMHKKSRRRIKSFGWLQAHAAKAA